MLAATLGNEFDMPDSSSQLTFVTMPQMRRGKQIAQGAHASMALLTRRLQSSQSLHLGDFSHNTRAKITGSFAKVCVRCDSE